MSVPSMRALLVVTSASVLLACGGDAPQQGDGTLPGQLPKAAGAGAAAGAAGDADSAAAAAGFAFKDTDFVESEQNRDPFRSFDSDVKKGPAIQQRRVLMPNTPIANMKLIAIITGIDQPKAMIVDERGVGYVTTRGDFVGVAEVVQSGSSENLPVTLNWRVDRIRENEVVLAREDPSGPNRPPLTKIIPLHEKGEQETNISDVMGDDSG